MDVPENGRYFDIPLGMGELTATDLRDRTDTWDGDEEIQQIMAQLDKQPASLPSHPLQSPQDDSDDRDDSTPDKVASRPSDLLTSPKKKIIPAKDLLAAGDREEPATPTSINSSELEGLSSSVDSLKTPDDLTTPDVFNNSILGGELEWEGTSPSTTSTEPIAEYDAKEELEEDHNWRTVTIGEKTHKIDMKVIEPYKKVLSHGGYYGDGFNAIIVFCGCYLPAKERRDYDYVMDNLFLYVVSTLELLVVEDYMIVYFHGATPKHKMPGLVWLKRCYDIIDRRLKKNLKGLLIVHPTLWLKTVMLMTRPFISSKFSRKLRYVRCLSDLQNSIPTEYIYVPDEIKSYDIAKTRGNSAL